MKKSQRSLATNASPTRIPLLEQNHQYASALSARASKTASRVAAAEAKARAVQTQARAKAQRLVEESCMEATCKREEAATEQQQRRDHKERAKEVRAEKKAAKQAEAAAKKQKKVDEKRQDAQRKTERKAEKAYEKERRRYLGGVAWGYDPKAGVNALPGRLTTNIESSNNYSSARDHSSRPQSSTASSRDSALHYYDRVTGRYYPRSEFDTAWGIEVGGPNRTIPPGPHTDRLTKATAEVDKTSRTDRGGLSRDPGPSRLVTPDGKGKGRIGVD